MVEHHRDEQGVRLLLTPNRSLSWPANVRIWLALCLLSLCIVTGMALAGAWLVIPFAGLELGALAAAFYYTARQCRKKEVLSICGDTLRLEKGINRKQAEWELPRRYTRVYISHPRHPFTPPKLRLRHRDVDISLGAFLNMQDASLLLKILETQGLQMERARPPLTYWF
ncbi:MAG: DUF2244 domain-containing protein [Marinobacter sp.]|uniref:DUF2244 domain-containing protein n=1 Tax=Marinobacter sp. TaxID=50741 RepID=UPI00299ECEE8|nr:DUF2244 domain-containing protein [Marinobacter sp.]MDX1635125.1 DUF2244 domain-containing protein [Marinobacter sp.]